MKNEKNIVIAFGLNLGFSLFELAGGLYTGSVAILSDALHDFGDALSIGLALFFEKKSKKGADSRYPYGYRRFSALGGFLVTLILLVGSLTVMANAIGRLFAPTEIRYDGMILFAVVGLLVNGLAVFVTREGDSVNHKAVNLHLLEDVLGWAVVLVGAVIMRFIHFPLLDPLMSIGVSLFILVHAVGMLAETADLFLDKTPRGVDLEAIKSRIASLDGVLNVRFLRIRSLDGEKHIADVCIGCDGNAGEVKKNVKLLLYKYGITDVTVETAETGEDCCPLPDAPSDHTHHHHHHHHHRH